MTREGTLRITALGTPRSNMLLRTLTPWSTTRTDVLMTSVRPSHPPGRRGARRPSECSLSVRGALRSAPLHALLRRGAVVVPLPLAIADTSAVQVGIQVSDIPVSRCEGSTPERERISCWETGCGLRRYAILSLPSLPSLSTSLDPSRHAPTDHDLADIVVGIVSIYSLSLFSHLRRRTVCTHPGRPPSAVRPTRCL